MTIIHHVTIACPVCGDVQTVALTEEAYGVFAGCECKCGATCRICIHERFGEQTLETNWTLPEGFRLEAL